MQGCEADAMHVYEFTISAPTWGEVEAEVVACCDHFTKLTKADLYLNVVGVERD